MGSNKWVRHIHATRQLFGLFVSQLGLRESRIKTTKSNGLEVITN